jgi:hypothetical protein
MQPLAVLRDAGRLHAHGCASIAEPESNWSY